MSMNKFMHPRNIYRQQPDFQAMVQQFPELKQVSYVDLNGRIKLDYKNKTALQLLTHCLLLRDFKLDVELPPDKLIPTLPLRLNYVHWLEDFETAFGWKVNKDAGVRGLDIGCGASCIYPLLCVVNSQRRWKMVGLEQAEDSVKIARTNVERNGLNDAIEIIHQDIAHSSILKAYFSSSVSDQFDFCMCNPPFYALDETESTNRTGRRKEPPNIRTGTRDELQVTGGEVAFITQMITESLELKDRVTIYSTMIGHKKSFVEILKVLDQHSITNTTTTKFCQGNTTRWGVAWSFSDTILLCHVPDSFEQDSNSRKLTGKPLEGKILELDSVTSQDEAKETLFSVLASLDIKIQQLEGSDNMWKLEALQNTWSHQRRKRRENQRKLSPDTKNNHNEQLEGYKHCKRVKLTESDVPVDFLVKAAFSLKKKPGDGYYLSLIFLGGSAGRDSLNQILQYVKNALNKSKN
ncbi:U6 small nuclear RNA (adenine-(43)-N(6))-methyltransferase [Wyeomyia smithii]|uniref:U6 small nuclear RNA (adenine-(43)-N(6))-methyltransferase n=1 Tax=Wyeomyia smithii TaxID=174621 RepID=UPI002467E957|nr:U6 small nuclear RNA (adenine-(43)-N(6))-methyltransferase [Wyeomyia smithii]